MTRNCLRLQSQPLSTSRSVSPSSRCNSRARATVARGLTNPPWPTPSGASYFPPRHLFAVFASQAHEFWRRSSPSSDATWRSGQEANCLHPSRWLYETVALPGVAACLGIAAWLLIQVAMTQAPLLSRRRAEEDEEDTGRPY